MVLAKLSKMFEVAFKGNRRWPGTPMSADALIESLSAIHPKGYDLSLERIENLLVRLDNPQHKIPPVIHVAGTNGKGSTIAFCRAILEAAGKSVHVHTSPHLVNWHERFRLGKSGSGKLVSDPVLEDAIQRVADANRGEPITVFELLSATMFVLFAEHEADYTLMEVGLGGRFDATNVIKKPLVSVISPISVDHQSFLGDTIEAIAGEKAGIIKNKVPVIIGTQVDEAREVLEVVAAKHQAQTQIAGQDFDHHRAATGFVFQDGDGLLDLPLPKLAGEHQLENAALAIAAIRAAVPDIAEEAFATAMKSVTWPGRLERLPKGKITERLGDHGDIWIDGGHNPSAGEAIAGALARMGDKVPTLLICGMINTKEPLGYFKPFSSLEASVMTVPVSMSDAGIAPDELAGWAREAGLETSSHSTFDAALDAAANECRNNPNLRVFFCGSLYLAGEVLKLNGTPPT